MSGSEEMGYQDLPAELKALDGALRTVFGISDPSKPVAGVPTPYDDRHRVELAIMQLQDFDYLDCWELMAAVQAKLERKYEDRINETVAHHLKYLRKALEEA